MRRSVIFGVSALATVVASLAVAPLESLAVGHPIALPSPSGLIKNSLANAENSRAVHEVAMTSSGGQHLTMTNDIGTSEGRQVVSFTDGAQAEILGFVAAKHAYFEGNKMALQQYFGFTSKQSGTYANKWMSVTPKNAGWQPLTQSITLASDFSSNVVIQHPTIAKKTQKIDGVTCWVISGNLVNTSTRETAKVTLYVSDAKTPLPVQFNLAAGATTTTVKWTQWGESLTFVAPTHSVPAP